MLPTQHQGSLQAQTKASVQGVRERDRERERETEREIEKEREREMAFA